MSQGTAALYFITAHSCHRGACVCLSLHAGGMAGGSMTHGGDSWQCPRGNGFDLMAFSLSPLWGQAPEQVLLSGKCLDNSEQPRWAAAGQLGSTEKALGQVELALPWEQVLAYAVPGDAASTHHTLSSQVLL